MRPNKLRELLRAGKPTLGTHINLASPAVIEMIGHTGLFDYVEFVAEYGTYDLYDLDHLCRTAELYDLAMIIKIDQEPRTFTAQRAIGSGFQGVLFADVRSADDARQCVRAVRPETPEDGGLYGVAARRFAYPAYGGTPEYVQALRDVIVLLMIEKRQAVEDLEAILAVPGIDMIQWGGVDYAMSIGRPGQARSPEVKATEKRVLQAAMARGIPPRAEIGHPDQALEYLDLGIRHFCIGWDLFILYQWWKAQGEAMRKILADV
ncbi:MAG: aldolase/citrate lyase family protein [Anaerolineae bacterium]